MLLKIGFSRTELMDMSNAELAGWMEAFIEIENPKKKIRTGRVRSKK